MPQLYEIPAPSTNDLAQGWFDSDYQPNEADYEEMELAQLEAAIERQSVGVKQRLRDQLDRLLQSIEDAGESGAEPGPWG